MRSSGVFWLCVLAHVATIHAGLGYGGLAGRYTPPLFTPSGYPGPTLSSRVGNPGRYSGVSINSLAPGPAQTSPGYAFSPQSSVPNYDLPNSYSVPAGHGGYALVSFTSDAFGPSDDYNLAGAHGTSNWNAGAAAPAYGYTSPSAPANNGYSSFSFKSNDVEYSSSAGKEVDAPAGPAGSNGLFAEINFNRDAFGPFKDVVPNGPAREGPARPTWEQRDEGYTADNGDNSSSIGPAPTIRPSQPRTSLNNAPASPPSLSTTSFSDAPASRPSLPRTSSQDLVGGDDAPSRSSNRAPSRGKDEDEIDFYTSPEYNYKYQVKNDQTGDQKSFTESRSGDAVKGEYSFVEPDGTLRVVQYTADGKNGFVAVVKRGGETKSYGKGTGSKN